MQLQPGKLIIIEQLRSRPRERLQFDKRKHAFSIRPERISCKMWRKASEQNKWGRAAGGVTRVTTGVHYVNRVCYLVTELPHNSIPVEFRVRSSPHSLTPLGLN